VDALSGIVGIFNLDGRPTDRALLERMTGAIVHRGPDGEGVWTNGLVGLGHRLLKATPESLGERQPVCLGNESYVVVCDGRIDNRQELFQSLSGHTSLDAKASDAELVLRAYVVWGTTCTEHLVGDFAFAIWDARLNQLFCARDPIGIKPFYYYFDGRRLLFGSEIKELFVAPDVPRRINEGMIGLWLAGGLAGPEQTFYEGIHRLPGGYSLLASREGLTIQPYWNPDPSDQLALGSDEEYVEQFSALFRQAVKARMRSIGPVGVLLSGGLDSSSVACVAEGLRRESGNALPQVQYYSATFPDTRKMDESQYIQAIADRYGIPGVQLPADDMWALKALEKPNVTRDEPIISPTEGWETTLIRHARAAGVRVMLTGEGGDQVLYAWSPFFLDMLWGLRLRAFRYQWRYLTPQGKRAIARQGLQSMVPWSVRMWSDRLWRKEVFPWIDRGFARKIGLRDLMVEHDRSPRYRSHYLQNQHEIINLRGRQPGYTYMDMKSAESGIEFRHPFWDRRLVEFLLRVPARQKYLNGRTKSILRRAMKDILPEPINRRHDKVNFNPLIDRGISDKENARLKDALRDPLVSRLGYIDAREIRRALDRYHLASDDEKSGLFTVFTLEQWLQETVASNGGEGKAEKVSCPPLEPNAV
jgi:asparagine synthase (glutamine-hydrolysing)